MQSFVIIMHYLPNTPSFEDTKWATMPGSNRVDPGHSKGTLRGSRQESFPHVGDPQTPPAVARTDLRHLGFQWSCSGGKINFKVSQQRFLPEKGWKL